MEELIQTYGRQIREVGFSQHLAKQKDHLAEEKDHISNKFYKSLRRDKALNQGTTRDRDASYSRPEGERNNLERVGLPKFGGKNKVWPDFRRGYPRIALQDRHMRETPSQYAGLSLETSPYTHSKISQIIPEL